MVCPNCGSDQISFQVQQVGAKTTKQKRGCLWSLGRLFLIICTCGLWLLVGKSKGKEKTKFQNQTVAVCQKCGNTWAA